VPRLRLGALRESFAAASSLLTDNAHPMAGVGLRIPIKLGILKERERCREAASRCSGSICTAVEPCR
jgi:hypothetical protein